MQLALQSLTELAPTLADLKGLPLEIKSRFLLNKLAQIDSNLRRSLTREELIVPGDPYDLSLGYAAEEKQDIREHLLAEPWRNLIDQGFLSGESDRGMFTVSEKGISSLIHAEAPVPGNSEKLDQSPADNPAPRVFVSYAWESASHIAWVRQLAERLQGTGGVEVILDQWHLVPGGDRLHFMEQSIETSEFVIAICTPGYAARGDKRDGGVGYESMVITSSLADQVLNKKFIPVLRLGTWQTSVPIYLRSKLGVDLRNDPFSEPQYEQLLRTLHHEPLKPPPRGPKPSFTTPAAYVPDIPAEGENTVLPQDQEPGESGKWKQIRRQAWANRSPQIYLEGVVERNAELFLPVQPGGKASFISLESTFVEIPFQRRNEIEPRKKARGKSKPFSTEELRRHRRVLLLGGPGSGKTTILRRFARELALEALQTKSLSIPLLIRAPELIAHIDRFLAMKNPGEEVPSSWSAPLWLSHYLWTHHSKDRGAGLRMDFFEAFLRAEACPILIDGFDEAPLERIQPLLSEIHDTYRSAMLVVSGRRSMISSARPFDSFTVIDLLDLAGRDRKRFLQWWSGIAFSDQPHKAQQFVNSLLDALEKQRDIRSIADTPLTLSMLCSHWLERQALAIRSSDLHEQLISSTHDPLMWERLQKLAVAMQIDRRGKRTTISLGGAADLIAESEGASTIEPLQESLRGYVSTGMITVTGSELRFWHSSFQDFLVSRALVGMPARRQAATLADQESALLDDEWHDALAELVEILSVSNPERLDDLGDLVGKTVRNAPGYNQKARGLVLLNHLKSAHDDSKHCVFSDIITPLREELRTGAFSDEVTSLDPELRVKFARCFGSMQDPRTAKLEWIRLPPGTTRVCTQSNGPEAVNNDSDAIPGPRPAEGAGIDSFEMTRVPITVGEYRDFVRANGYAHEEYWTGGGFRRYKEPTRWEGQLNQLNCPVTGISWFEAAAFCAWAGAELPSEAQWECAAGTEERMFPWGSAAPDNNRCWFGTQDRYIAPVGIFPAGQTPEGILDLAGNTWEWTSDAFSTHSLANSAPSVGGTAPVTRMVIKGGSNTSPLQFLRNTGRAWASAESRYSNFGLVGFRCVRRSN